MNKARKLIALESPVPMKTGVELAGAQLAYETFGEDRGDNRVLIFTGLSPDAHVTSTELEPTAGWWEDMVGAGKPIDTDRWFVICFNSLGSCFGSTGPASINPATGRRWAVDFPVLHIEDIAGAAHMALRQMGIDRINVLVGPSMGGMVALAYLAKFGDVDHLVSISSATAADPYAIAVRSLQRELIRSDPAWREGNYDAERQPVSGMRLARKLGMTTYRSAEEWRQRFGRERIAGETAGHPAFPLVFEVEGYLQAAADRFVGQFDANCYQYLSRAMDLFDLADFGEPDVTWRRTGLHSALVIGVETDQLFGPHQQRELARQIGVAGIPVEFVQLASIQGHDAFLTDMERFQPVVRDYLAGIAH